MPQKDRVGIIILVILLILSLAGAVIGFYSFKKERLKTIALNEELENLRVEKRIAEEKLAETETRIDGLNAQLQASQIQISGLKDELEKAESEKKQFYSQVEDLQYQLQEQERIRKEWEAKQAQAQDQIKELQVQLQKNRKELEAQSNKSKTGGQVALGKIVVGPKEATGKTSPAASGQPQTVSPLEGKVLVVNKEYDFAVINLGAQDAINAGDIFSVYHGDSYIGNIQVDKTRGAISACGFTSKELKDKISEGDRVIRR